MRRTREERAITLIALIITIVVLLILAVVAINAVTGDGIIQHATNAKTEYEKAQSKENDILSYYEDYLTTKGKAGTWKQDGDYIINNEDVKIPVGATVTYNPETGVTDLNKLKYTSYGTKTGIVENQVFKASNTLNVNSENQTIEWKVMGVENGKIVLIASKSIAPIDEDNNDLQSTGYTLSGKEGYNNGIEELNNICSIYGYGKAAESARSLSDADIEKIAEITEEDRKSSDSITKCPYGNKYTYEYVDGKIKFYENGGTPDELTLSETKVYFPDEIISSENPGPREVISNSFSINISDKIRNEKIKSVLLNNDEIIYISDRAYQVVNQDISASLKRGYLQFNIRGLGSSAVYSVMPLYTYTGKVYTQTCMIRPVVILEANTVLSESNGIYNIV